MFAARVCGPVLYASQNFWDRDSVPHCCSFCILALFEPVTAKPRKAPREPRRKPQNFANPEILGRKKELAQSFFLSHLLSCVRHEGKARLPPFFRRTPVFCDAPWDKPHVCEWFTQNSPFMTHLSFIHTVHHRGEFLPFKTTQETKGLEWSDPAQQIHVCHQMELQTSGSI